MSLSPAAQSPPAQRNGAKKRKRSDHDAELLPLLRGPSVELVVGSGDETAAWTIPVALLTKHSNHFRATLSSSVNQSVSTANKVAFADRCPSVFQIYVQWMYFDTIPSRYNLSRTSTGKPISNSFQLWALGDHLQVDGFKNRIMTELHASYSLQRCLDGFDFVELSPAEVDYCWGETESGSKLREFMLDVLAHHLTFGAYVQIKEGNEWYKLFMKHADLHVQTLARIAASSITFAFGITSIPAIGNYLETVKEEIEGGETGSSEV